jgi:prevent-host-death family protein
MDDAAMPPFSPAERELLAELDDVQCTCGGQARPVHGCPPCAAQLIKRLQAEIVSLQIIADEALTAASTQPADSRHDHGGAREHAQRLLRDYFRAAFVGAGLAWHDEHDAQIGAIIDSMVTAAQARTPSRRQLRQVNIYEAKTTLSRLVDEVNAGSDIIIARNGRPVAQLIPCREDHQTTLHRRGDAGHPAPHARSGQ